MKSLIKSCGYIVATATLSMLIFLPSFSHAETVVRSGESISINADQVVENDFYATAGTVFMSGEVVGDMYAVGGTVTQNGKVRADLSALGGAVQVQSSVGDDVRVVGGEVVISDHVGGDVFVVSGTLKILSTATIDGDVFFYGGEADISGPVSGSIMGTAGSFRIDTVVGRDVDVVASNNLTLGSRAKISGNVTYSGTTELNRAQDAVVTGSIIRNQLEDSAVSTNNVSMVPFLMLLFAALCIYLFFRNELTGLNNLIFEESTKVTLFGLIAMFGLPIVVVLMLVTVLGTYIGVLSLLATLFLFGVAFALLPILLGGLLFKLLKRDVQINILSVIVGTVIVELLLFIPVVGTFVILACFVLTLGALTYTLYKIVRQRFS